LSKIYAGEEINDLQPILTVRKNTMLCVFTIISKYTKATWRFKGTFHLFIKGLELPSQLLMLLYAVVLEESKINHFE
jgi:hypothetical protein